VGHGCKESSERCADQGSPCLKLCERKEGRGEVHFVLPSRDPLRPAGMTKGYIKKWAIGFRCQHKQEGKQRVFNGDDGGVQRRGNSYCK